MNCRWLAMTLLSIGPVGVRAGRASWMKEARFGVMTHYLADWRARTDGLTMSVDQWNELVDHFDVDGLAEQIKSAGAGYHILTIGQNSGYYAAPNATYDKLTGIRPGKCSRRDLISDMAAALGKRGIRLIVYLPAGAPGGDREAREALQWENGAHPNREFQGKWEQIIREWSQRWGDKIAGWWFDGCYWPNTMYRSAQAPNFESFAAAARAGNRASAIAFNPGVVTRLISIDAARGLHGGRAERSGSGADQARDGWCAGWSAGSGVELPGTDVGDGRAAIHGGAGGAVQRQRVEGGRGDHVGCPAGEERTDRERVRGAVERYREGRGEVVGQTIALRRLSTNFTYTRLLR